MWFTRDGALMTEKWICRFIKLAEQTASWSKDPRRKVGCLIVDPESKTILSGGYNGFARGIKDDLRLEDKVVKNRLIIHAEANTIAAAARNGHSLLGGVAFITNFPCLQCAGLLLQAGVTAIVCKWDTTFDPTEETRLELLMARNLVEEASISFTEITKEYLKQYAD
jgi:dCMP deaminase